MRRAFTTNKYNQKPVQTLKPKYHTIKEKCLQQNSHFKKWNQSNKWATFHISHYDWWAFPIDQPSSYGSAYQIGKEQREKLVEDEQFIQALRSNAILVCRAWGWDLIEGKRIVTKDKNQRWQNWPIRLWKMNVSLELFKQEDLLINGVKYGNLLVEEKEHFIFRKRDLSVFFTERKGLL